jgi:hypothetical protein
VGAFIGGIGGSIVGGIVGGMTAEGSTARAPVPNNYSSKGNYTLAPQDATNRTQLKHE